MGNADLGVREVRRFAESDAAAQQLLETAVRQLHLSASACHRVQKLARTIADLAGSDWITTEIAGPMAGPRSARHPAAGRSIAAGRAARARLAGRQIIGRAAGERAGVGTGAGAAGPAVARAVELHVIFSASGATDRQR
jgi:hypothetical protein